MLNTFFLLHRLIFIGQKDFRNIENIVICFYVLKFSKENCFTLPFYCTVLCAWRSTKEGLNYHREFLRKNQETLQISVFSLILLNLFKNVLYFLFIALPCGQSALNHLIHSARLRKNQGTLRISIILNLVQKLFYTSILLQCAMYNGVLERNLRQLPSQNMLKNLGYILQLTIFHIMLLNLVKKSVLYFLSYFVFIALPYVQGALVINL